MLGPLNADSEANRKGDPDIRVRDLDDDGHNDNRPTETSPLIRNRYREEETTPAAQTEVRFLLLTNLGRF